MKSDKRQELPWTLTLRNKDHSGAGSHPASPTLSINRLGDPYLCYGWLNLHLNVPLWDTSELENKESMASLESVTYFVVNHVERAVHPVCFCSMTFLSKMSWRCRDGEVVHKQIFGWWNCFSPELLLHHCGVRPSPNPQILSNSLPHYKGLGRRQQVFQLHSTVAVTGLA